MVQSSQDGLALKITPAWLCVQSVREERQRQRGRVGGGREAESQREMQWGGKRGTGRETGREGGREERERAEREAARGQTFAQSLHQRGLLRSEGRPYLRCLAPQSCGLPQPHSDRRDLHQPREYG